MQNTNVGSRSFFPKNSYAEFVPYLDNFHMKQLRMLPLVTPVLPSKKKKTKHSEWKLQAYYVGSEAVA